MSKSCRKSILCRPRRGRCCLGGAVFVVFHFRHLRIALSSAEALRGVSINSQRLSPNKALHLSSMKAEHQTHRCCAVSFSSPQNLPSADSCLPTSARQLPRAVWWPHLEREIYTLLSWQLTPSSSRFLVWSLVFYHTGIELRRHACWRVSPVPPPAGLLLWGVLLSVPDIILAALSWVRSSLSLLVLEIQGPHAGAAYSSKLP